MASRTEFLGYLPQGTQLNEYTIERTEGPVTGALTLGTEWQVRASRELLEQLETLVGRGGVQVLYGAPPPVAASMSGN